MQLQDRVALITGAASGIGKAAARLFAREGARVLIADRDEVNGPAVAAGINAAGGTALFVATDVSQNADAARAVQAAVSAWGRLDILYNNAAPTRLCNERDRAVHELDEAVWDTMIAVALKGVFLMSKQALPVMMRQRRGVILNTSTIDALLAEAGVDSYTAAKGGVIALTRAMALNYAQHGIRVNTISPGYVLTECQQGWAENPAARAAAEALHLTRLGRPEDIAELALFLASDKAEFMTGSNVVIDGGFSAFKSQPAAGTFFRTEP
ncbi:MAG: SDR family NAD(P)-dependent oxidoreductase [Verrucomicrobiota bacterium]|nr:SDR family NAD(P)-dependent oxidoreductase [Opitutales bacterium]